MRKEIIAIVHKAGEMIRKAECQKQEIHQKSSVVDLVTEYDVKVEEFLRQELAKLVPDAGFLGEEEGGSTEAKSFFVIDPIDGTTNFIRGYHHSNISVGFAKDGVMQIGVIYDPFHDEMFSAQLGKGAFLNETPIVVSDRSPAEGLFLVGSAPYEKREGNITFPLAEKLFQQMADFRRQAAAALDFCYVACGRAEVYYEPKLSPWDYAAGALIAKEAGAVVQTLEGKDLPLAEKSSVFVSNPKCKNVLS